MVIAWSRTARMHFSLRSKTLSHPRHYSIVPFPPTHDKLFRFKNRTITKQNDPSHESVVLAGLALFVWKRGLVAASRCGQRTIRAPSCASISARRIGALSWHGPGGDVRQKRYSIPRFPLQMQLLSHINDTHKQPVSKIGEQINY